MANEIEMKTLPSLTDEQKFKMKKSTLLCIHFIQAKQ